MNQQCDFSDLVLNQHNYQEGRLEEKDCHQQQSCHHWDLEPPAFHEEHHCQGCSYQLPVTPFQLSSFREQLFKIFIFVEINQRFSSIIVGLLSLVVAVSSTGAEAFASIDMSLTLSSLVSSREVLFVLEVELSDFDCSF